MKQFEAPHNNDSFLKPLENAIASNVSIVEINHTDFFEMFRAIQKLCYVNGLPFLKIDARTKADVSLSDLNSFQDLACQAVVLITFYDYSSIETYKLFEDIKKRTVFHDGNLIFVFTRAC